MDELRLRCVGRRVYRGELYGPTTSFTYDGDDVLLSNTNSSITTYQNGPGIDNNLSTYSGSSSSYAHRDHLGTPLASSTTAGVLTGGTSITDSFGNGVSGFTGREYDSYLELQYSRARMYDPKLGRFISEDPIGFAGGDFNLYGYVRNNPVSRTDPFGLCWPWEWAYYYYYTYKCGNSGIECKRRIETEFAQNPITWCEMNPMESPNSKVWRECFESNPDCQLMIYYGGKCGVTAWPPGQGPLKGAKAIRDGLPSSDPLLR